jgi:hypothetical protein
MVVDRYDTVVQSTMIDGFSVLARGLKAIRAVSTSHNHEEDNGRPWCRDLLRVILRVVSQRSSPLSEPGRVITPAGIIGWKTPPESSALRIPTLW